MNLEPRTLKPAQRFPLRGGGSALITRVCHGTFNLYGEIILPDAQSATLAVWTADGKYYSNPRITSELDVLEIHKLR